MRRLLKRLFQGNTIVWVLMFALAVFSFMPVFSGSRSLYHHFIFILSGAFITLAVHRLPSRFFSPFSVLALGFGIVLLAFALVQGQTIGGANASRWVSVGGMKFQPSALTSLFLLVYLVRQLVRNADKTWTFRSSIVPILLPIAVVCGLILPANFSTSALVFFNASAVLLIGGFPFKHWFKMVGIALLFLTFFIGIAVTFPDLFSNRVDTWKSRLDSYFHPEKNEDTYQIDIAKMAIAEGHITGQGPGRGIQKNFLPQKNTDFIYALIVEEWGILGGTVLIFGYLWLFFQILKVGQKAETAFGHLLCVAIAFSITFQALINMAVAVNLFPVTGQTLPLVSEGGTSIWTTCLALGMVLSVSRGKGDKTEAEGAYALGGEESVLEAERNTPSA